MDIADTYFKSDDFDSSICWYGDNGVIDCCNFYNDHGINGGAVTWQGNNGFINNTQFINSSALGVGGALYNIGENVQINNSLFLNSTSGLVGEALFTDKKMHISSTFNTVSYFYNNVTDFDSNIFKSVYFTNMGDTRINLIPVIYASLREDLSNMIDNKTRFYSIYDNQS